MNRCTLTGLVGASLVMIAFQPARADVIARYECSLAGFFTQEPIGDRPDHNLVAQDYVCVGVEGVLKGAVYSASNVVEWDGPKATMLIGSGVHRIPGGRLITQLTEGSAQAVMKDGKPVGVASSGKGLIKFASGPFAGLNGKTVQFATKPINPIRFDLEFRAD